MDSLDKESDCSNSYRTAEQLGMEHMMLPVDALAVKQELAASLGNSVDNNHNWQAEFPGVAYYYHTWDNSGAALS